MTFYKNYPKRETVNKVIAKLKEKKCPYCSCTYTLGVNGVEDGCDPCIGIIRNPIDHTIISARSEEDLQ